MKKGEVIKRALIDTLPIFTGYIVLGFGFGFIMKSNGYTTWTVFAMSLCIYAGSAQYAAIGLLTGGASLLTTALTTLTVNARHLFYGISMIDKYKNTGKAKPYLIFALTDETYSLVCGEKPYADSEKCKKYWVLVSVFDHIYWIAGSLLGAFAENFASFNSAGVDFALTALFVTIFTEQWLTSKNHMPAITGIAVSAVCRMVFGKEMFLIFAMIIILVVLCLGGKEEENA